MSHITDTDESKSDSIVTTNVSNLYDKIQIACDELYGIAFDQNKWGFYQKSDNITVESKQGKYGVPIFRATSTIKNDNNVATPEHFYSFLLTDYKIFDYLRRGSQTKLVHIINKVNRIVETIVNPNEETIFSKSKRNFLYYQMIALCDENGKVYTSQNSHTIVHSNKHRTLMAVFKSVNENNDSKYYTKPSDPSQVRGMFYRTGIALQYISKTESKIVMTLEYDVCGSSITRSLSNNKAKISEIVLKMCRRLKKKLEFAESYSFEAYEKCKKLEIEVDDKNAEIMKLQKELLQFKDWKAWNINEFIIWICHCLEDGKFRKYQSVLRKNFISQEFKVCKLDKVSESDLFAFGVTNFGDKKCLMEHIQNLTKSKTINVMEVPQNILCENVVINADTATQMEQSQQTDENDFETDEYQDKLPKNWTVLYTKENEAYYHNEVTDKTQWDRPIAPKVDELL